MRAILLLALVLCANSFAAFVAVLETISVDSAITASECRFLTDELRAQAGAALPAYMNYTIMTRENINVMLPPGKTLEECEGSCIAETGKNIAADYVAQARVGKFGEKLTLTVELYETATSKLLGSYTALQSSAVDLWNDIKQNSKSLFARIQDATRHLGNFGSGEKSGWDASPFDPENNKPKAENKNTEQKTVRSFFEDPRDGKRYRVVVIGKKAWLAENLKYELNGSECYNMSKNNCGIYGRYYTWAQAMAVDGNCNSKSCEFVPGKPVRGVCPEGWHIPSIREWEHLISYVDDKSDGRSASVLKATYAWKNNGTNESKFGVLPGGFRFQSGNFMGLGTTARFWTSTEVNPVEVYSWEIHNNSYIPELKSEYKSNELPVRCTAD